jgi:hypothetical protein
MNTQIKCRVTCVSLEDDHEDRIDLALKPDGTIEIVTETIRLPRKRIVVPTKGSAKSCILEISDLVSALTWNRERRNAWVDAIREGARALDPDRVAAKRPYYPCLDVPEDGEFL